ncbi:hypothetical protein P4159_05690 [Bacillus thuringiensis]|uniref:hypothetical protein n=1 Tax=Bacillus cereus group TaxID=86661 RepID=UPI000CD892C5|nr:MULTISPECIES: hypothetical protein [Bacillus cereus group]MEC3596916.1 hypothetical protein [Bacillus thuringiensis]MED1574265.1 hypothetical protein [Bacillus paranthracis]MED1836189.1 hypothetical protein [Bacillus thuringiensis]MED2670252.1 hypothetical protein [Bacillus thuringiensis]MED2694215.1 hypothetical protein [Bacillus thuringiensis]
MKMNRGQLLVMAFEGKIKKGDQFKSNRGDIIIFDGHAFVWKDGGQMLRNRVFGNETFTPHTPTVSIDLTEAEALTIRAALFETSDTDVKHYKIRRGLDDQESASTHTLLSKVRDVYQSFGGTN